MLEKIRVDLPDPGPGEVTVEVRAAGMNPADYKHFGPGQDPKLLPLTIRNEVAGVISALGPDTEIRFAGDPAGDEVVVFRVADGYSTALNASAEDVFVKPSTLSFPQAANLLLVGTTAAETLDVIGLSAGEVVLVHGAAGGVGTSVVQQARLLRCERRRDGERARLRRSPTRVAGQAHRPDREDVPAERGAARR